MPSQPRFVISFLPASFISIKSFIIFLCRETGVIMERGVEAPVTVGKPQYFLMSNDCILLTMDSIHDNDRLTLIPSQNLQTYTTSLSSKLIPTNLQPLLRLDQPLKPQIAPLVPTPQTLIQD